MVFPEKAVPSPAVKLRLPAAEYLLELQERKRNKRPVFPARHAVELDMLKLEHHGKLASVGIAVQLCALGSSAPCFSHGDKFFAPQNLAAQLPDIFVQPGSGNPDLFIRFLAEVIDHVQPKPAHAARCPPAEYLIQLLPQGRILPIEIRLFYGILVEVILPKGRYPLPRRPAEGGQKAV